jgi:hypothetical protein
VALHSLYTVRNLKLTHLNSKLKSKDFLHKLLKAQKTAPLVQALYLLKFITIVERKRITILGAGIAGLVAAYERLPRKINTLP